MATPVPRTVRRRLRILIVAGIAAALIGWFYFSRPCLSDKTRLPAEDEVYATVVHYSLALVNPHVHVSQLVFSDAILTGLSPEAVNEACTQSAREWLPKRDETPPFNSLEDKVYRALTFSTDVYSLRTDTVQDFIKEYCIAGRLSQSFHTDLPRTFIAAGSVGFREFSPKGGKVQKSFEDLFPGAYGIVSFSHVGFDRRLDRAIVAVDFVCGRHCGTARLYVLRKESGNWKVVSARIVRMY